jgi:translation initiation factor 2 subunit 1
MIPKPVKIRSEFKLTCFKFEGIEAMRHALSEGERLSTNEISIKFRILGSPIYECTTETINKSEGLKLMGDALKKVESSIRHLEGNFLIQVKPTIIGEASGKEIDEQLKDFKKDQVNQEEDDDNSEEDHTEGIVVDIEGMNDALKDDDLKLTAKKPHESDDDNYYKYDKLY